MKLNHIPEELGNLLVQQLYKAKVIIKQNGVKHRGKVTDISFSNGILKVSLDNKIEVVELGMESYLKVLK